MRIKLSTGTCDIADLLDWTFQEELPKRESPDGAAVFGFPNMSPMFRMLSTGMPIGANPRSRGADVDDPHPDALIVEQHVAKLQVNADELESADLGAVVGLFDEATIRRIFARATRSAAALVAVKAALGCRPIWDKEEPMPQRMMASRGRHPMIMRTETRREGLTEYTIDVRCQAKRRGVYPAGAFCPITWDPEPSSVALDRAEYLTWWLALAKLAKALSGRLKLCGALTHAAARAPWGRHEVAIICKTGTS
jgi:hypothetical protein